MWHQRRKAGQSLPSPQATEKITPSASLFGVRTTLHCSLLVDSVCLCHNCVQAFILNEGKDRGRLRMESMNLHRNHNWEAKLGLTCISWATDWTHWHRYDVNFFCDQVIYKINMSLYIFLYPLWKSMVLAKSLDISSHNCKYKKWHLLVKVKIIFNIEFRLKFLMKVESFMVPSMVLPKELRNNFEAL